MGMQSRGTTVLHSPILLLLGVYPADGWRLSDGLFSAIINVSLWPHIRSTSTLLLTANTASCVGLAVLTAFLRGQLEITPCQQINNPSLCLCILMCHNAIWEQWTYSDHGHCCFAVMNQWSWSDPVGILVLFWGHQMSPNSLNVILI